MVLDGFFEHIRNSYYFFEDKWYALLDKVDEKIPIYNIVDKVDNVVPSFILFLLVILFLIILTGYFIQFSSSIKVTFITVDSNTQDTIAGVNLRAVILNDLYTGTTNSSGELIFDVSRESKNIYDTFLDILSGFEEIDLKVEMSATKPRYREFSDTFYTGRKHTISLSKMPIEEPVVETFPDSTIVRLIDAKDNSSDYCTGLAR